MKKVILLLAFICCFAVAGGEKFPKYIILFIGDGMTYPQRMTAEEFVRKNGGKGLAMNHMPCHATTRSCSANSIVTDSAASGTAIACGRKTNNGRIGVDSSGKVKLESTAEFAARKGWKVGIVSTMVINHATPASFFGHRSSRSMYYELGLDMINSGELETLYANQQATFIANGALEAEGNLAPAEFVLSDLMVEAGK